MVSYPFSGGSRRRVQACLPDHTTATVSLNANGLIPPPEIPTRQSILPAGTPDSAAVAASSGVHDLDEEDIFATDFHSPEPNHRPNRSSSLTTPNQNPSLRSSPSRFGPSRFHKWNIGILAALPEEDNYQPLLHRNLSSYSSSTFSSARMIPAISKPKLDYVPSLKGGKIYHHSVPMNVPVIPLRAIREATKLDCDLRGDANVDEEEMLPPHEIVARAASKESPMTTFSMLEGFGRTLKGRDLRRVRNAVWRQTGFQD